MLMHSVVITTTVLYRLFELAICSIALEIKFKLVSNWILTSSQPQRFTSEQSNSVTSKCTFQNSSHIYIYKPSMAQVSPQNQSLHEHETYMIHEHQTQIFKEFIPSIVPLLKRAHKASPCWYCWPCHPFINIRWFKK